MAPQDRDIITDDETGEIRAELQVKVSPTKMSPTQRNPTWS